MARGQVKAQLAMDETLVEDEPLEAILEERLTLQEAAGEARKDVAAATERAMARIVELELGVGDIIRVGRFRISRTETPGRSVSFETAAKERVKIALAESGE